MSAKAVSARLVSMDHSPWPIVYGLYNENQNLIFNETIDIFQHVKREVDEPDFNEVDEDDFFFMMKKMSFIEPSKKLIFS